MKKYKKTLIILGVILVLVAAAVVTVVLVNESNAKREEEAAAAAVVAISHPEADELAEFTYTYGGEAYTMSRGDSGNWIYKADPEYPLVADSVQSMAQTLINLSAVKSVDTGKDRFADFGLSEPLVSIEAAGYRYLLGNYNDVTSDYYLYSEKDDTVYTTDYQVYYYFAKSLYDIGEWKDLPVVTDADITGITIKKADGTLLDVTDDAEARAFVTGLTFNEVTDYCPDAASLTEYELDTPKYTITVTYDGGEYTLLVGKLVAEIQKINSDGSMSPDQYLNVKLADDSFVHQINTMYLPTLEPASAAIAASATDVATATDAG